MNIFTDPYVVGAFFIGLLLLGKFAMRAGAGRTLSRESAVIVRRARAKAVVVALDQSKLDAVEALVRDGWKRKAAVSALASAGWHGYPNVPDMVLNAWKTMPGYRS